MGLSVTAVVVLLVLDSELMDGRVDVVQDKVVAFRLLPLEEEVGVLVRVPEVVRVLVRKVVVSSSELLGGG